MSTGKTLLIAGAVGAAAWYVYKTYMLGSGLQFVPISASFGGNGVLVNIGVQNPSNTPTVLSSFSGNLMVNGSSVANVSNFQGLTIAPNAQTVLQFNVAPNWFGVGADVLSMINSGVGTLKATLTGTANVNGTPIPVTINF